MPDPNIIGGERVAWSAAIVLACILLYLLTTSVAVYFSSSGPASSGTLIDAGFFSGIA